MPTDPRPGETLDLFPRVTEPPLLVLLRSLCAGEGCHPCPDGVTLDYLVWAGGGTQPEDRDAVAVELDELWRAGKVLRSDADDPGADLWRAR